MSERKKRLRRGSVGRKRLIVTITTYNRPKKLLYLLKDILKNKENFCIEVWVFDDFSSLDYSEVITFLKKNNWKYYKMNKNFGKKNFYSLYNILLNKIKMDCLGTSRSPEVPAAKYYFQLQDDLSLCENFFSKSIKLWNSLPKEKRGTLNLLLDDKRLHKPCWTNKFPKNMGDYYEAFWVDCIYMCVAGTFKAINWKIDKIPPSRWDVDKNRSSGVGQNITLRLFKKGIRMYKPKNSLVFHNGIDSQMNPKRKEVHHAVFNAKKEKVSASLASIPSREKGLRDTYNSLINQVDQLNIYLNGYSRVPSFIKSRKACVIRSQDYADYGDAGKFFKSGRHSGYYFSCDDDIVYPSDYVAKTISNIEKYNRKAIVGYHGVLIENDNFSSYYSSRNVYHFRNNLSGDSGVHILGTGVLAYHSDTIKISIEDFKIPNMADIWFAEIGQKRKIPFICISHKKNWIKISDSAFVDSIYDNSINKTDSKMNTLKIQNKVAKRNIPWKINYV